MFEQLSQYLFQNKYLNLPSVGIFTLSPQKAALDMTKGLLEAPGWNIEFVQHPEKETPAPTTNERDETLLEWLSKKNGIAREEAVSRFDSFQTSLINQLNIGKPVSWNGVGQLIKNQGGIFFQSSAALNSPFAAIEANPVVRENQNYQILVGTRETNTETMLQELSQAGKTKNYSSTMALLLLALAVLGLVWYFVKTGGNLSNTGNQQMIELQKPAASYRIP